MTASIAHLKIKLDEVKPAVVRRVEVPLTIRLDRLHLVLQAAMGWTNSHLYEIRARDIGWGVPDPDFGDGPLDARKARLVDVLEDAGVRSLNTSTISATAGNTASASSASPRRFPELHIRAWSKRADGAHRRTSAVPGATATSSKRSPIQTTNSMPRA
jgi:hypothetical protein